MKHLYFVRHGLSVMNKAGIFSGRTETPLTPEGITQAREAGRNLRGTNIDVIVSSPIKRAHDTAIIIAEELDIDPSSIVLNELFVERSFGPLEGTTYTRDHDLDAVDGVEHSSDLLARVGKGYEFVQSLPADSVLVVGHGSVGRALRHCATPSIPFHGSEHFPNAKVVKLL